MIAVDLNGSAVPLELGAQVVACADAAARLCSSADRLILCLTFR